MVYMLLLKRWFLNSNTHPLSLHGIKKRTNPSQRVEQLWELLTTGKTELGILLNEPKLILLLADVLGRVLTNKTVMTVTALAKRPAHRSLMTISCGHYCCCPWFWRDLSFPTRRRPLGPLYWCSCSEIEVVVFEQVSLAGVFSLQSGEVWLSENLALMVTRKIKLVTFTTNIGNLEVSIAKLIGSTVLPFNTFHKWVYGGGWKWSLVCKYMVQL